MGLLDLTVRTTAPTTGPAMPPPSTAPSMPPASGLQTNPLMEKFQRSMQVGMAVQRRLLGIAPTDPLPPEVALRVQRAANEAMGSYSAYTPTREQQYREQNARGFAEGNESVYGPVGGFMKNAAIAAGGALASMGGGALNAAEWAGQQMLRSKGAPGQATLAMQGAPDPSGNSQYIRDLYDPTKPLPAPTLGAPLVEASRSLAVDPNSAAGWTGEVVANTLPTVAALTFPPAAPYIFGAQGMAAVGQSREKGMALQPQSGASQAAVDINAVTAGALEYATEKIGMDAIQGVIAKRGWPWLARWLVGGGSNTVEELIAQGGSNLSEMVTGADPRTTFTEGMGRTAGQSLASGLLVSGAGLTLDSARQSGQAAAEKRAWQAQVPAEIAKTINSPEFVGGLMEKGLSVSDVELAQRLVTEEITKDPSLLTQKPQAIVDGVVDFIRANTKAQSPPAPPPPGPPPAPPDAMGPSSPGFVQTPAGIFPQAQYEAMVRAGVIPPPGGAPGSFVPTPPPQQVPMTPTQEPVAVGPPVAPAATPTQAPAGPPVGPPAAAPAQPSPATPAAAPPVQKPAAQVVAPKTPAAKRKAAKASQSPLRQRIEQHAARPAQEEQIPDDLDLSVEPATVQPAPLPKPKRGKVSQQERQRDVASALERSNERARQMGRKGDGKVVAPRGKHQQEAVKVGERFGVSVAFVDGDTLETNRGQYDTMTPGVLLLRSSLNTPNHIRETVGHEIGHDMARRAPGAIRHFLAALSPDDLSGGMKRYLDSARHSLGEAAANELEADQEKLREEGVMLLFGEAAINQRVWQRMRGTTLWSFFSDTLNRMYEKVKGASPQLDGAEAAWRAFYTRTLPERKGVKLPERARKQAKMEVGPKAAPAPKTPAAKRRAAQIAVQRVTVSDDDEVPIDANLDVAPKVGSGTPAPAPGTVQRMAPLWTDTQHETFEEIAARLEEEKGDALTEEEVERLTRFVAEKGPDEGQLALPNFYQAEPEPKPVEPPVEPKRLYTDLARRTAPGKSGGEATGIRETNAVAAQVAQATDDLLNGRASDVAREVVMEHGSPAKAKWLIDRANKAGVADKYTLAILAMHAAPAARRAAEKYARGRKSRMDDAMQEGMLRIIQRIKSKEGLASIARWEPDRGSLGNWLVGNANSAMRRQVGMTVAARQKFDPTEKAQSIQTEEGRTLPITEDDRPDLTERPEVKRASTPEVTPDEARALRTKLGEMGVRVLDENKIELGRQATGPISTSRERPNIYISPSGVRYQVHGVPGATYVREMVPTAKREDGTQEFDIDNLEQFPWRRATPNQERLIRNASINAAVPKGQKGWGKITAPLEDAIDTIRQVREVSPDSFYALPEPPETDYGYIITPDGRWITVDTAEGHYDEMYTDNSDPRVREFSAVYSRFFKRGGIRIVGPRRPGEEVAIQFTRGPASLRNRRELAPFVQRWLEEGSKIAVDVTRQRDLYDQHDNAMLYPSEASWKAALTSIGEYEDYAADKKAVAKAMRRWRELAGDEGQMSLPEPPKTQYGYIVTPEDGFVPVDRHTEGIAAYAIQKQHLDVVARDVPELYEYLYDEGGVRVAGPTGPESSVAVEFEINEKSKPVLRSMEENVLQWLDEGRTVFVTVNPRGEPREFIFGEPPSWSLGSLDAPLSSIPARRAKAAWRAIANGDLDSLAMPYKVPDKAIASPGDGPFILTLKDAINKHVETGGGMVRPDLSQGARTPEGRAVVAAVDSIMSEAKLPSKQRVAKWENDADRLLLSGPDAIQARLAEVSVRKDMVLLPHESRAVQKYIDREGLEAAAEWSKSGNSGRLVSAAVAAYQYRRTGNPAALALRARQDALETPAERNLRKVSRLLVTQGDEAVNTIKYLREMAKVKSSLAALGLKLEDLNADALADPTVARQVLNAIKSARSSTLNRVLEYYVGSILSAVGTHVRNTTGNLANMVWSTGLKHTVAAVINEMTPGSGDDAVRISELGPTYRAMMGAVVEGAKNAVATFNTETAVFDEKLGRTTEINDISHANPGRFGRVIRVPMAGLMAADQFAKTIVATARATGYAHRRAKAQGLSGQAYDQAVADELSDYSSDSWQRGADHAIHDAFQGELGPIGKAMIRLRATLPVTKFLFPFVTTPVNITKQGIVEGTPLGAAKMAYKGIQHAMRTDESKRYDRDAVMHDAAGQLLAVAAMLALWGGTDDDDPWITGYVSNEPNLRAAQYRNRPPQSIKVGGKWHSYATVEPVATSLSAMVTAMEKIRHVGKGQPTNEAVAEYAAEFTRSIGDKTFMQTLGDLMDVMQDPSTLGEFGGKLAAGFVPNVIRSPLAASDEPIRERRDLGDVTGTESIMRATQRAVVPWAAGAQPKVTEWGEEVRKGGSFLDRIVGVSREYETTDDIGDTILSKWNAAHPADRKSVSSMRPSVELPMGKNVTLTDEEFHLARMAAGRVAARSIERIGLNTENPSQRDVDIVLKVVEDARRSVGKVVRGAKDAEARGDRGLYDHYLSQLEELTRRYSKAG